MLRLHRPGYNTAAELESEVAWVTALSAAGLQVSLPVPTTDGGYYAEVPVGPQHRQVGVIEWVDGESLGTPLGSADPDVVNQYRQIGEVAAKIRVHSSSWTPPERFVRRRWDADGLVGNTPVWGRFWDLEALNPGQRALFSDARDRLVEELGTLSTGPDRFGLIHADLHLGNLMADGKQLTVIDFDDAGFGWFAHELAVALNPVVAEPIFDEARDGIVEGYRHVFDLSDEEEQLIDSFVVMRSLMLVAWLDARRELASYRHFDRLASIAETVAGRYLDRPV